MRREEAEKRCAQHNSGHPQRGAYRWAAQLAGDGEWRVVRVRVPGGRPFDPVPTTEARPGSPPPDPRPSPFRDVPPYGPGI
jgi:hypothetical protein